MNPSNDNPRPKCGSCFVVTWDKHFSPTWAISYQPPGVTGAEKCMDCHTQENTDNSEIDLKKVVICTGLLLIVPYQRWIYGFVIKISFV